MPGRPPSQFEVNLNAIDDSLSSSKFRSIISNNISKSKLEEFSRKLNQLLFETAARDAAPRDHELQGGVEHIIRPKFIHTEQRFSRTGS